jgi:hypothetical protein
MWAMFYQWFGNGVFEFLYIYNNAFTLEEKHVFSTNLCE